MLRTHTRSAQYWGDHEVSGPKALPQWNLKSDVYTERQKRQATKQNKKHSKTCNMYGVNVRPRGQFYQNHAPMLLQPVSEKTSLEMVIRMQTLKQIPNWNQETIILGLFSFEHLKRDLEWQFLIPILNLFAFQWVLWVLSPRERTVSITLHMRFSLTHTNALHRMTLSLTRAPSNEENNFCAWAFAKESKRKGSYDQTSQWQKYSLRMFQSVCGEREQSVCVRRHLQ